MQSKSEKQHNSMRDEEIAAELIGVIRELAEEFHVPAVRIQSLNLDTSFDTEIGLDSLTRVEFISRIENRFSVRLSEQSMFGVETPRELLREILRSSPDSRTHEDSEVSQIELDQVQQQPIQAQTLVDVLKWHLQIHPERPHIKLYNDQVDDEEIITYRDLWEGAETIAVALQQQGLAAKQAVSIMLPTGKDYLYSFFGILLAGGIPVPIYPPVRLNQLEDHLLRHQSILNNCQAVIMITVPEAKSVARLLKTQVKTLRTVIIPGEVRLTGETLMQPKLSPNDIAFLQYTSGSTGTPKGVTLTHANLLANIRLMGERVGIDSSDVFVSWLPLYHDMGLIGAWLGSLYFSAFFVLMSPLNFLARPSRWLWAIHRNRGTMTAGPNFAYELCAKKIPDEEIDGLDLSCLKAMFNGAEAVKPATLEQFTQRYQPFGFPSKALMPVYGLAECSLGLAFPAIGRGPKIDAIERYVFSGSGRAVPNSDSDNPLYFVCCGSPLRNHEIRIVDPASRELPERQEGRLQFRGPSVTCGYYRNPDKTLELFDGEWADSGDLAYIAEGEVFLTGRVKDIIIHAGRNIYPHELEEAVCDIPKIRKGCVAAFGSSSGQSITERLIVLAETRETDSGVLEDLRSKINRVSMDLIGSVPEEVVLARPYTVLKTSSGKIRRSACRDIYERGLIDKGPKAVWKQVLKLLTVSIRPQLLSLRQQALALLFAVYAWIIFAPSALVVWLAVVLSPSEILRWKILHLISRFLTFAMGIPVLVHGPENLPEENQPCIFVCNHSSYLDHLMLLIAIPGKISFVAKAELTKQFFAGTFLKRMNVLFVERFDTKKGIDDAKRITEVAKTGASLLFYPEGTFTRMPGLLPFNMGAFLISAETGVPIVPVTIRGTRSILRPDSLFPRYYAPVRVTIGKAIHPETNGEDGKTSDSWQIAVKLRSVARAMMLETTGEPDLAGEKSPVRAYRSNSPP